MAFYTSLLLLEHFVTTHGFIEDCFKCFGHLKVTKFHCIWRINLSLNTVSLFVFSSVLLPYYVVSRPSLALLATAFQRGTCWCLADLTAPQTNFLHKNANQLTEKAIMILVFNSMWNGTSEMPGMFVMASSNINTNKGESLRSWWLIKSVGGGNEKRRGGGGAG